MACVLSPADGDEASFQSGTEVHSSVRSVTATRNGISMAGQSISARPYRTARLQGVPAAARGAVLYSGSSAGGGVRHGGVGLAQVARVAARGGDGECQGERIADATEKRIGRNLPRVCNCCGSAESGRPTCPDAGTPRVLAVRACAWQRGWWNWSPGGRRQPTPPRTPRIPPPRRRPVTSVTPPTTVLLLLLLPGTGERRTERRRPNARNRRTRRPAGAGQSPRRKGAVRTG
jgi:hypothetical protein